ncbi:MAG: enoyl-CoA hydratase [Acidimicrobiales bacterium]|nr:enoyl-CoA hydratase [Acidimicrobiales bacterium]MYA25578.1 enoyl-CoA hydratase [Acidimicrobiales bacterium]MYD83620.1 enoyl-CoA hydratase [Acidimicrobiales bacterium]MYG86960.1 enoyl-CoA hydratase [Acidimicrobiales bacterium]MYI29453.1 enoyl-CoA hydratase [Acidimicrobiales bacterium]
MESAELETLIIDAADNGVVTITMNRPKRLNAASPQMFTELRETWNEIGGDPTVRCVVMTGAGDAFCSGADLAADGGDGPRRHALQGLNVIHQTVSALYSIMVPVIAKVNGVAAGAGMNLALACDLIVASDQARFSEIFARRGLSMDFGGTWILPRLIGLHRAKELAFFADVIDAKQAEDFGIVNKVVPHGELDAFVDDWADRLAAGPPIAVAMTKRLLTLNASADFAAALEAEGMAQSLNFTTEDTKEAVKAFLEKRPPTFTGR